MTDSASAPASAPLSILQRVFGYATFRGQQAEIIDTVVRGGDALEHYPEYRRVVRDDDGVYRVHDRTVALRHRF